MNWLCVDQPEKHGAWPQDKLTTVTTGDAGKYVMRTARLARLACPLCRVDGKAGWVRPVK